MRPEKESPATSRDVSSAVSSAPPTVSVTFPIQSQAILESLRRQSSELVESTGPRGSLGVLLKPLLLGAVGALHQGLHELLKGLHLHRGVNGRHLPISGSIPTASW